MKSAFGLKKVAEKAAGVMADSKNESIMVKVVIPELNEKKVFKVSKAETIGDLIGRMCSKFDVLALEQDALQLVLDNGKALKNTKTVGDYRLHDNTTLTLQKRTEPAAGAEKEKKGSKKQLDVGSAPKSIFGATLAAGARANNPGKLPYAPFIEHALQYLVQNGMDTEGIFRLSGMASEMNAYKDRINRGEAVDFRDESNPHNVAGLIKLYLRELKEPLMTFNLYDAFIATQQEGYDEDTRAALIRGLVACLPAANRALLKRLCGFFDELAAHADVTKMHFENLATVFGPNILRRQQETAFDIVSGTAPINAVAYVLLSNYHDIFMSAEPQMITSCARAEHHWQAANEGEISFAANDIVFVRNDSATDGWWEGWSHALYGLFPTDYVKVIAQVAEGERPVIDDISVDLLEAPAYAEDATAAELEAQIQAMDEEAGQCLHETELLEKEIQELNEKITALTGNRTTLEAQLNELQA